MHEPIVTTVDIQRRPIDFAGVSLLVYLDALAVDLDVVFTVRDFGLETAQHRVVLQKVCQCFGIRDVIDGNDVDILVANGRAEKVASDPPETIDSYLNRHSLLLVGLCEIRNLKSAIQKYTLRRACISHTHWSSRWDWF